MLIRKLLIWLFYLVAVVSFCLPCHCFFYSLSFFLFPFFFFSFFLSFFSFSFFPFPFLSSSFFCLSFFLSFLVLMPLIFSNKVLNTTHLPVLNSIQHFFFFYSFNKHLEVKINISSRKKNRCGSFRWLGLLCIKIKSFTVPYINLYITKNKKKKKKTTK